MRPASTYRLVISVLLFGSALISVAQNSEALIHKGDSVLELGKTLRAVSYFDQAIAAGGRADAYSARAQAWYKLDRMDRFILDVETALDYNHTHPEAQFQRALYAMRSYDWSLAKTSCDRAIKAGITESLIPRVRICRGEALVKLGKTEAAIDDLRSGIDAGEKDVEAMRLLASLYHKVDLHASAIQVLEKLLATKDSDIGDRINLGYQMAMLGRHVDAIKEYNLALSNERNNPIALSNLAYSLYKLGKNAEAMDLVKRSLRSQPGNPYALRTRGMLRLSTGDKEKACKDLYAAKLAGDFKDIDKLISQHCLGIKRK